MAAKRVESVAQSMRLVVWQNAIMLLAGLAYTQRAPHALKKLFRLGVSTDLHAQHGPYHAMNI